MAQRGFTLIELMIVVAMISILATVAVPTYNKYIETAATSEANTILADISSKETAYHSAWHLYIKTESMPTLDKIGTRTPQCESGCKTAGSGWEALGYAPNVPGGLFGGPTFFKYAVTTNSINDKFVACACRNLQDPLDGSKSIKNCFYLTSANTRFVVENNTCISPNNI